MHRFVSRSFAVALFCAIAVMVLPGLAQAAEQTNGLVTAATTTVGKNDVIGSMSVKKVFGAGDAKQTYTITPTTTLYLNGKQLPPGAASWALIVKEFDKDAAVSTPMQSSVIHTDAAGGKAIVVSVAD